MSLTRQEGKDMIIFASKEDHATPSKIELPEPEPSPGLLLPNGEINWNCPCLGGMATGPCGVEFRDSFTCFHYSNTEPKGTDCYEIFHNMQVCMSAYPSLYKGKDLDDFEDDDDDDLEQIDKRSSSSEKNARKEVLSAKSSFDKSNARQDISSGKKEIEKSN